MPPQQAAILGELDTILGSPAFRHSARSRQFLEYVVRRKLERREDLLKERTIGAELFRRRADYSTGDDPIVRVQAGEVRRRLEHYYQTATDASLQIELPVGSYVPEIRWRSERAALPESSTARSSTSVKEPRPGRKRSRLIAGLAALAAVAVLAAYGARWGLHGQTALNDFWAPALATPQPVLICLSKPVLYRPALRLYSDYSKTHPGTFQTEVERLNQMLPLDPKRRIAWGDMIAFPDFGVGAGDVYAAFRVSELLGRMKKSSELRVGNESSFDDLRNSPAVIVGAFSNRWTLETTSNLRFVFSEKNGIFWIQDRTIAAHQWFVRPGPNWTVLEDYGVATRLVNSRTGQLLIAVAGLTAAGSDAAGEFVTNESYLDQALVSAPRQWKNKNMQVVVKTEVVDSVAGPPQVVATYFW